MAMLFVVIERGDSGRDSLPLLATANPKLVRRVIEVLQDELSQAFQEHETDWDAARFLDALTWDNAEGGDP